MKQAIAAALIVILAGCATPNCRQPKPVNGSALFNQGYESGRHDALSDLRHDMRVRLSAADLSHCDTRASSLPSRGAISSDTWWKSRGRNLWTLDQCDQKNEGKRSKLILMSRAIQGAR
ncbi:hypothetical protein C41B8_05338 [Salinisphaera hydrothermalis C41B8]|uniref:Lipoprotein n=1 Tax=Salinisphaera hydrothermalis (strain C41B8) TaxID=1304275 RepID=A0A084INL5_SALHC|nr:hypothetical protein C41B8_05338 [Salinisphaera hydrothermalis C41B8]